MLRILDCRTEGAIGPGSGIRCNREMTPFLDDGEDLDFLESSDQDLSPKA